MAIKLKVREDKIKLKAGQGSAYKLKASEGVPIYPIPYTGVYEVTPTESEQSLSTNGLTMTDDVTVHAVPSDYVGSAVDRRSSTDLTASGATVTVPSGFYEENASKDIPTGTVVPPVVISSSTSTLTAEDNVLTLYKKVNVAPYVSEAGYISQGTRGDIDITLKHAVPTRSSADLTASGATVTAPSGYYSESASASVQSGSATTPTGGITANPTISVSSSGLITASVSKSESITPIISEGYVTEGTAGTITFSGSATSQLSTEAGKTVAPTESEQTAVSAEKFTTGAIKVGAISPTYVGSGITQRSSSDLAASGATVTAPAGYYGSAATKTISSGSATPAASITGSSASKVVGNGTITLSKTVANTPQVTAGYVASGTQGNTNVELSASLTTQGAQTIHPSTTDQSVSALTYLTGAQTFKAVTTSNLTAENIKDGVTVKIGDSTDDDCVTSVTGSYTGETPNLQAKTNINPTTSSQTIQADNGYDGLSSVQINAMPSGTEGTPTATKGTVSSHSISVTPSVTNSAGYISGGTHSGTAVSVSASELVSGTKSITANGTGIDVTEYAAVDVAVPSGSPSLQSKSVSYTPTETAQSATVTADSGYDGLSSVAVSVGAISSTYVGSGITQRSSSDLTASGATVSVPSGYYASNASKAVASGSATAPSTISGTSATVSTGTNSLTLSKTVSVTPSVSAGYVSSGTAGNSNVSLTASVTTQAAQTIYPSTSDQSISASRYLTGAQTIKAVTTSNLTAENIKSGVTVTVGDSANASRVASVTGTYTGGGGGSSDVVMGTLTVASNVNTSTSTKITDTTAIGFTPTKFFFWKDSRTATSNHLHQATFTTIGSYYIRTMTRYSSNALSTSGNTNNWTTQTAGYLYYNSNTIYIRSSSSYILSSGTWYWVAVK